VLSSPDGAGIGLQWLALW